MSVLKGTIYVNLEAVEDRAGNVVGFRPVAVTQSPSKGKGIPVQLDLEIDSAVFEPLRIAGGTVTISAPVPSSVTTVPPPPAPAPAPTTAYGKALAKAQGQTQPGS